MARYRLLNVTPALIVAQATEGSEMRYQCIKGLPDEARIVRSYYDPERNLFSMVVEHTSFDHVPEGQPIPPICAEFERLPI